MHLAISFNSNTESTMSSDSQSQEAKYLHNQEAEMILDATMTICGISAKKVIISTISLLFTLIKFIY